MTEPSRSPSALLEGQRLGLVAIAGAVVAFSGWVFAAPIQGAVIAQGLVKPSSNRKAVQHSDGGVVSRLLVQNGNEVRVGQALVELEDVKTDASVLMLQEMLFFEFAKRSRLAAEQVFATSFQVTPEGPISINPTLVSSANEREQAIFKVRRAMLVDQQAVLLRQQSALAVEQQALQRQILASRQVQRLANEELRINENLLAHSFVSRARLVGLERTLAEAAARLAEHEASLAQSEQRRNDIALRIASTRSDYQRIAAEEFKETSSRVVQLREQLRPAADAQQRQVIRAPVSGWVVGLKLNGRGEIAQPREVLMEIVPLNEELVVEARVGVDAIAHLKHDQLATLRFTTFNSRITPTVTGFVSYLAADAVIDKDGAPSYVIQIRTQAASLSESGIAALKPGMAAEIFVTTQPRRVSDYVFAPITDTLRRALREP